MMRMKNIIVDNKTISCDIIPEDSKTAGRAIYDIEARDVVKFELPQGYEYCKHDIAHVRQYFQNANIKELPREKLLMWY